MVEWKNLDTLNAYEKLQKVAKVDVAKVMSGESGANRVKTIVFQWLKAWLITMQQKQWMMMY